MTELKLIGIGSVPTSATLRVPNSVDAATLDSSLTVSGKLALSSEMTVADRFPLLNSDYTSDTALTSGFVFNVDPSATSFTITGISSNVISLSGNPTGSIATNDFILIQNPNLLENKGLYEVASITTNSVTIDTSPTEDFSNSVIVDDATSQGTVVNTKLAILRTNTSGGFESATGTATPLSFSSLDGASTLAAVLAVGASTGGTDLSVLSNDKITSSAELTIEAAAGTNNLDLRAGSEPTAGNGGNASLESGDGGTGSGNAGTIVLQGGSGSAGNGGTILIDPGSGSIADGAVVIGNTRGNINIANGVPSAGQAVKIGNAVGNSLLEMSSGTAGTRLTTTGTTIITSPSGITSQEDLTLFSAPGIVTGFPFSAKGGAGGLATSAGGLINLEGGAGGNTSGNGGDATLKGGGSRSTPGKASVIGGAGNGFGNPLVGGSVDVDGGFGTTSGGDVNIGPTNSDNINVGLASKAQIVNIGTSNLKTINIGSTDTTSATNIHAGPNGDIYFNARGATNIPINSFGADANLVGFTATSVVGALNELQADPKPPTVALSTVTVNQANYVIDPGVAATGPFFLVVNGIMYSDLEGFFIVSGVDNRTWTWQDIAPTGQLTTTDRVLTWHY